MLQVVLMLLLQWQAAGAIDINAGSR